MTHDKVPQQLTLRAVLGVLAWTGDILTGGSQVYHSKASGDHQAMSPHSLPSVCPAGLHALQAHASKRQLLWRQATVSDTKRQVLLLGTCLAAWAALAQQQRIAQQRLMQLQLQR